MRRYRYKILRKHLKNSNFSLISNNCLGAIYLHDIGMQFLSPTVNCYILPKDYLKFLSNLDYYLGLEIKMAPDERGDGWLRGYIGDVPVTFLHFKSEDEPRENWEKRRKRVNKNNMFFTMTERDGCTYEDLVTFDQLPYKHKVVFTVREYPEIKSAFCLKGCIDYETNQLGYAYEYPHRWSLRRYVEQFDLIAWFNGEVDM